MFGTTYPIFGIETTLSERLRDRGLADYVRWEFAPADRAHVLLSARRGRRPGGPRRRRRPGIGRRLRAWIAARQAPAIHLPDAESSGDDAGEPA